MFTSPAESAVRQNHRKSSETFYSWLNHVWERGRVTFAMERNGFSIVGGRTLKLLAEKLDTLSNGLKSQKEFEKWTVYGHCAMHGWVIKVFQTALPEYFDRSLFWVNIDHLKKTKKHKKKRNLQSDVTENFTAAFLRAAHCSTARLSKWRTLEGWHAYPDYSRNYFQL